MKKTKYKIRTVKIVATRCQILRLKCSKINFGWGSALDPAEELTMLFRPPCWNKGDVLLQEGCGAGG